MHPAEKFWVYKVVGSLDVMLLKAFVCLNYSIEIPLKILIVSQDVLWIV